MTTRATPSQAKVPRDGAPDRRRRADAERNIAAILDAAMSCFAEDPAATMADVARAAGVGRVTLYAHFPSRRQLLEAALERGVAEAAAQFDAEALDDLPADEALGALLRSSWRVLDRHRMVFEALQGTVDHRHLRRHHDPVMARFDELVTRGQDEGSIRTDLPRDWLVAVIFNLLHTAAAEVNTRRMRTTDAADVLHTTVRSLLAPDPTAKRR